MTSRAEPNLAPKVPESGVQAGPSPTMMVDDEARRLAADKAERDRETLARLIRQGVVTRDPSVGRNVAGADRFVQQIEAMVRPPVNLAIRPRRRRRR